MPTVLSDLRIHLPHKCKYPSKWQLEFVVIKQNRISLMENKVIKYNINSIVNNVCIENILKDLFCVHVEFNLNVWHEKSLSF